MAAGLQDNEGVPQDHLRRKLAAAVRSVQWSYAIFWGSSTRQPGLLEWSDGYYNGDIKTRKTVQPVELNADEMGLQRSEQLRELYASLAAGDSNPQAKRPSASLSPEDLTDLEWYYLVCMSFTYSSGQGLPGRAFASGLHIWLCNVHHADSKVFSRSLLAKSASIQTVVCFPLQAGVLELGITEQILEEATLIQCMTTTFLEFPKTLCSRENDHISNGLDVENMNPLPKCDSQTEGGPTTYPLSIESCTPIDVKSILDPIEELQKHDIRSSSSDDSSNESKPNGINDDSLMVDGMNGNSPVQSWQFMGDEFSNLNSSDFISQSFANVEIAASCDRASHLTLQELQKCNHTKLSSLDLQTDDPHYSRTLAAIFRNSNWSSRKPSLQLRSYRSSFWTWRKDIDTPNSQGNASQKMLKKILFGATGLHGGWSCNSQDEIGGTGKNLKLDDCDYVAEHTVSERKRREKLNEKFSILKSLVPSISKADKASILGDTIEYLKELERKVEELEACKEPEASEVREKRKHPDIVERTSDNYCHNDLIHGKKSLINKRKSCNMDEADAELNWVLSKDGLADVTVTIIDKEVSIEMKCPWRECLLLEIVDAMNSLHLDAHMVQSSTTDGTLNLTLKSKFKGTAVASAGMIKQALQRVVGKY